MVMRVKRARLWALAPLVPLLCCSAWSALAWGGEKQHPLEGKVIALGTTNEMVGGGSSPVVNGTGGGSAAPMAMVHRTYTIKTPTRVYVLECPYWMNGFHIHSARECGGSKTIAIGDVVHFRMAKSYAYIPTDNGREQKLSVLSEAERETPQEEQTNP